MNNNPVRYNDPTGHDAGCAGHDCDDYEPPVPTCPLPPQDLIPTSDEMLYGGSAITSGAVQAENGWDGYSNSGATTPSENLTASTLNAAAGAIDAVGWGLNAFEPVIDQRLLDNGSVTPEVTGGIYFGLDNEGLSVTGAFVTNHSSQTIKITSVTSTLYTQSGQLYNRMYPGNNTTMQPTNYGVASPGRTSGIVRMNNSPVIHPGETMRVLVRVVSSSGSVADLLAYLGLSR